MMRNDKNIALVTGSAIRIGKSIILALVREGFAVAIHYNNSISEARSLADEINSSGGSAIIVCADLSSPDETKAIIPHINKNFGTVNLLINNASCFINDNISNFTTEILNKHLAINLQAAMILSQSFINQNDKPKGNIINMLDYSVLNPPAKFLSYNISKSALLTLTKSLALTLAPHIRVNAIAPGPLLANDRQNKARFEESLRTTPLGLSTNQQEICDTVKYILATKSITGQVITLDGGRHLDNSYEYF